MKKSLLIRFSKSAFFRAQWVRKPIEAIKKESETKQNSRWEVPLKLNKNDQP